MRAKKIKTPRFLANIQITRQKSPQTNVQAPAMLIRPTASLKYPTNGLPTPGHSISLVYQQSSSIHTLAKIE
jgi:hypothetical protein